MFRDAMGLVPLSRTLEDYISAPMLVMSESFGCEVHVDKSADKFENHRRGVRARHYFTSSSRARASRSSSTRRRRAS